jgi:acetolactate synthase-1/3 small subunit
VGEHALKHTISGLVRNHAGILAQLVGAFKGSNLNIKSVAVSETDLFETSRLTMVVEGDGKDVKQVTSQVKKLRNVLQIDDLSRQEFLNRELALMKVHFRPEELSHLTQTAKVFGARVIAMDQQTMTFEIAAKEERVDGFITAMNNFGIRRLARSGTVALKGGDEV